MLAKIIIIKNMFVEEDVKFTSNLKKRIWRTIRKQNLISEGDKIMVALSGGKDSLVLLETLAAHSKRLPFKIDISACHVLIENMGYQTNVAFLQEYCDSLNVEFYLEKFEIDLEHQKKKSPCFICSWNRRKSLFNLTNKLVCNKLALGHHMDDAVETLFLNMIYHGSISSMPFSVDMFDGRLNLIRPMLEIAEKDLVMFSDLKKFPKEIKQCKYEDTKRKTIKSQLESIDALYKNGIKNIFRSLDNIYPDYLPHFEK